MINDEWYHCGDSLSEGVAFVDIELFLAKKPIHKSLWLQDDRQKPQKPARPSLAEGWAGGKPERRGLPPSEGETKNLCS
ncbi:MAG: hypothetical protein ACNYPD_08585 [Candidatus Halichondribacter symbioticus]